MIVLITIIDNNFVWAESIQNLKQDEEAEQSGGFQSLMEKDKQAEFSEVWQIVLPPAYFRKYEANFEI